MRRPHTLQMQLALTLGILLTLLWIGTAWVTAVMLRSEMDEVFDAALSETAQRLLPLAAVDLIGRDSSEPAQRIGAIRLHEEYFTYVVRDDHGEILLRSHAADPADFPPYHGPGFSQTGTHRLYGEDVLQGTISITVAEPLEHRAEVSREIQMGLALPLVVVIPATLLIIVVVVRNSFSPLRHYREWLAARSERDLSPVPADGLPGEIAPLAATLNALLDRLKAAFEAERTFAANAAHELRTPLAGAIAQAQRLQSETTDAKAARRAADIEITLKRLTRHSERLMQLARAEGGRLRRDETADLRLVLRTMVGEFERTTTANRIVLDVPEAPVLSDLDPDIAGIVCRNLIDNAFLHGDARGPVAVSLDPRGVLSVSNACTSVAPEVLARLTGRFERGGGDTSGSGLGLAIVSTLAERLGTKLELSSPRPGMSDGFEASVILPVIADRRWAPKT